jgi:hypothetical protein
MEGGVERRHLRHAGTQRRLRRADPAEVMRIVERCQVDDLVEPTQDLGIDEDRPGEVLATVHHPVAHGLDLAQRIDAGAALRIGEPPEHVIHGGRMVSE